MKNEELAYNTWKRIDLLRAPLNLTLDNIAAKAGMKPQTVKDQRSRDLVPKTEDLYNIARALNTTVEYLLTGQEREEYSSFDRELVRAYYNHPEHQESINTLLGLKRGAGSSIKIIV